MKRKLLALGLSLFLVGCSNNKNETIGTERINGTDISISSHALKDKSIQLDLIWKHGNDEDSSSKNSFHDLGIETTAFQNGRELFYDASQASELTSKHYDGQENNSSLGFELNNLDDIVEIRFGADGIYEIPGIFISLSGDKNINEYDKSIAYYKNEYFLLSDNFYMMQQSLVNANINDILFTVSENDKIRNRMKDNLEIFDVEDGFKNDIQDLINHYGDLSELINDLYNDPKIDSKERTIDVSYNIGKTSADLSEKYFDGEIPESLSRMKWAYS